MPALLLAAFARVALPDPIDTQRLLVHDVTLVDVVSGTLRPNTSVLVQGSRIAAVTSAAGIEAVPGPQVIDGRGRYLIPGLWDMHSHSLWSPEAMRTFLPLYVANGVTGIRDMGGRLDVLATFRDSARQGDAPWPRVLAAGQVLDGPRPVQPDISIAVSDAAGATEAVRSLVRARVDFVKPYTLLPREAYFAAIAEARRAGLRVAGHVPAAVSVEEAARAGQRSVEHLLDEIEPLCSPKEPAECARLAALFRANSTWQVPTLVTLRMKAFFDDPAMATDPRLRYVPAGLRQEWLAEREAKIGRGAGYLAAKRDRYAAEKWVTSLLARERVPLLAGTDAGVAFCYPGFSLHDELGLLVDAGLAPADALRAATLAPADYLEARESMGTIEAGRAADLVLLKANPLDDIGATRGIEAVVLRGRVLRRADLDALLDAASAAAQDR